jgi:hypothetical protein
MCLALGFFNTALRPGTPAKSHTCFPISGAYLPRQQLDVRFDTVCSDSSSSVIVAIIGLRFIFRAYNRIFVLLNDFDMHCVQDI